MAHLTRRAVSSEGSAGNRAYYQGRTAFSGPLALIRSALIPGVSQLFDIEGVRGAVGSI